MDDLKLAITSMRATALEAMTLIENGAPLASASNLINQRADALIAIANMPCGMSNAQLNRLDALAEGILQSWTGARDRVGVLSTGERLYIALAANDMTLVQDYTISEALARLGEDDVKSLVKRWQHRGK